MDHSSRLQLENLIERRRWTDARLVLARSFQDAPRDPDAHCYAARIASALGEEQTADEHVAQALAADPGHHLARLLRFDRLVDRKRWAEAETVILELLRESPDDAHLLAHYGRLMLLAMHVDKARALTAEALRREPDDLTARQTTLLLDLVESRRTAARGRLAELLRDDPEGAVTVAALFTVLVDQRRYREALRVGQELLRHDPDDRDLVAALIELRAATHWLALPAFPALRFGWLGSAVVWVLAVGTILALGRVAPAAAGVFAVSYLVYCIYTWTYGPLLKRWIARRGLR